MWMYGTMYATVCTFVPQLHSNLALQFWLQVFTSTFYPRIQFSAHTASDADTAGDSNIDTPGDCIANTAGDSNIDTPGDCK